MYDDVPFDPESHLLLLDDVGLMSLYIADCRSLADLAGAYRAGDISLAFVDNVSYVVGFRQLSIPLGATLGVLVLKEAPHAPKLVGVAIMFVGLMLVAMG